MHKIMHNRALFILHKKNVKLLNFEDVLEKEVQSTLVISTSVISNNRLSRTENLIPVLT